VLVGRHVKDLEMGFAPGSKVRGSFLMRRPHLLGTLFESTTRPKEGRG